MEILMSKYKYKHTFDEIVDADSGETTGRYRCLQCGVETNEMSEKSFQNVPVNNAVCLKSSKVISSTEIENDSVNCLYYDTIIRSIKYKCPLLLQERVKKDTIAVEDEQTWYNLCVVSPDGSVKEVGYEKMYDKNYDNEKIGPYCIDHVPNPMAVCYYASQHNMDICSKSLAAITRRWFNEGIEIESGVVEHSLNHNEE